MTGIGASVAFSFFCWLMLTTVAAQGVVDRDLQARWDAWYKRQAAMDCVSIPYDEAAINAVRRVHSGDRSQKVHGASDIYKRRAPGLLNLKTRRNVRGEGVIVTAWKDDDLGGSTNYSRHRSAWLVLDGTVYPLNVTSAGDIGILFDVMPPTAQKRSGLVHTFAPGKTMLDQLGIENDTFERRVSGGNPFPTCQER